MNTLVNETKYFDSNLILWQQKPFRVDIKKKTVSGIGYAV